MIPGQAVVTPDGQRHVFLEAWSPDGLTGPTHNGGKVRRIRYSLQNLTTGERWTTYDSHAFTPAPPRTVGA